MAPRILSLATAVPSHVYRQDEVREFAGRILEDPRLLAVFDHTSVGSRNICMPLEWFESEHSFGEKNDLYIKHAFDLSLRVARGALEHAWRLFDFVFDPIFLVAASLLYPGISYG